VWKQWEWNYLQIFNNKKLINDHAQKNKLGSGIRKKRREAGERKKWNGAKTRQISQEKY